MAATELRGVTGLWQRVAAFAGSLLAMGGAKAIELPENRAEGLYHLYKGGGVTADGPALLVRKSIADKVSLSGSYYVDAVSNASIDVVTTASPFKETRKSYDFGVDYAYRDALMSLNMYRNKEPDYQADSVSIDVAPTSTCSNCAFISSIGVDSTESSRERCPWTTPSALATNGSVGACTIVKITTRTKTRSKIHSRLGAFIVTGTVARTTGTAPRSPAHDKNACSRRE